jgi:hypothetical protein
MDSLMALAVLHLATAGTTNPALEQARDRYTERFSQQVRTCNADSFSAVTVVDDRQPVWFAHINPALLHLHARRVLGPAHPLTRSFIERLLSEYDPINQGWTNTTIPGAKPYTWATAIALRSCQIIRNDIRAGRMPVPIPAVDADDSSASGLG